MEKLLSTREVVSNVKGKVLGGAKVPHQCSMPVLRMVDQKLYLAFYVQFYNREQIQKQLLQRPSEWYIGKRHELQRRRFLHSTKGSPVSEGNRSKTGNAGGYLTAL